VSGGNEVCDFSDSFSREMNEDEEESNELELVFVLFLMVFIIFLSFILNLFFFTIIYI